MGVLATRLGIDISGTGPTVNGPIGNYQTFVKQTLTEQGKWSSILRSFSLLQAKETQIVLGIYIGAQLSKGEEQVLFPPVIDRKKGRHSRNKGDIESEEKEEKGVWEVKPVALTKKAIDTLAVKPSKLVSGE